MPLVWDGLQQSLAVQPPPVEQAGEVPLAGVAQTGHHSVARTQVLGDLVRGSDVEARGSPHVETELVQEPECL